MTTDDGCVATSNSVIMIVNGMPAVLNLQNITVLNNQEPCYDATQSIIVAGNGTTFNVNSGAKVIMIAGQKIRYLPGVRVFSGGKMHGYITTNGEYCNNKSALSSENTEGSGSTPAENVNSGIRLYPNPSNGNFFLENLQADPGNAMRVDIYNVFGEKVHSENLAGERKHEFIFSDMPGGLYFVKISSTTLSETIKLIKTR